MDWIDVGVMAAFGCNYEGDVTPAQVIDVIEKVEEQAVGCGSRLGNISLADTMGWANPAADQAAGRRGARPLARRSR